MSTYIYAIRIFVLSSIVISSVALNGCDALVDATSIDIPITVSIVGDATNAAIPSTDEACTDLSAEQTFADNIARIKGGTVSDVTLRITDLTNPTFTSGSLSSQTFSRVALTLRFDPAYGDSRVYTLGEFTNVSLADLMSAPRSLVLHSDANAAVSKMTTQPKFCVTMSYGAFTSGPAQADYIRAVVGMTLKFEARTL